MARRASKRGAAVLAALLAVPGLGRATEPALLPAPGSYVLQRIQRAPEAQLLDPDGKPAALSFVTKGALTALAFFYASCADPAGCPVAWATFEAVQQEASADPSLKTRLRLAFVSLDPTHDAPAVLRFLHRAKNNAASIPWLFLTSRSDAELAPLLREMGQDIAIETGAAGRRTGAINHMLKVFLIDPEGNVREIYTTAFLTPQSLLNDARTLALEFPNARNSIEAR